VSVNFNPDEKKFLLAQGTGSTVEVTQTDVAQESCFSNNGLSSNKVDLSQFENSSEWTPIQAQQNSKFLFFGNNGYTFKTSSGVEITIENPDDLGEAQIFENKETGEVIGINSNGAKIKSGGDNTSISIYNSQIDTKMNKVMKILTIVTTLVTPISISTSWFGMSFPQVSEQDSHYAYWLFITGNILATLGCWWYLKRKKFL